MSHVRVTRDGTETVLSFEGTPLLREVLRAGGFSVPMPCGGRGVCGKCALLSAEGALSVPSTEEEALGKRLLCRVRLLGDASVTLPPEQSFRQIELTAGESASPTDPMPGAIGAAVDIGTTTVAVKLLDLKTGRTLREAGLLNPQTAVAADVMGRIGEAMGGRGEEMKLQIEAALKELMPSPPDAMVVTGNTAMLYLLCGQSPASLSAFPFQADDLFDRHQPCLGVPAYFPPCMHAFVGADIACGVLASGMWAKEECSLLCDLGTNGEMALKKGDVLYVTSTAAGPAFEGAGISCGCGSVEGAIDRVWDANGQIFCHTIGGGPAVGICGSGLMDAVAAYLRLGWVDETGAAQEALTLANGLSLTGKDIRQVQLAKAAIAAGMKTLMDEAGVRVEEIGTLYIAGGFGSHLNPASAAAIGLIPEALIPRAKILGNAALAGAEELLLDRGRIPFLQEIVTHAHHVNLGGNPKFSNAFMDEMYFE